MLSQTQQQQQQQVPVPSTAVASTSIHTGATAVTTTSSTPAATATAVDTAAASSTTGTSKSGGVMSEPLESIQAQAEESFGEAEQQVNINGVAGSSAQLAASAVSSEDDVRLALYVEALEGPVRYI